MIAVGREAAAGRRMISSFGGVVRSHRWVEFLLVCLASLLIVSLLLWRAERLDPGHPLFEKPWDHHKYIHMAREGPFQFHIAPFCHRPGMPLLARLLPLPLPQGFLLLSLLGVWSAGVAMHFLVRSCGFSFSMAFIGLMIFFTMGWATKAALMVYWGPDALAFGLVACALICLVSRRDLLLALVLAGGVLVKESVLAVLPLLVTLRTPSPLPGRTARRALAVAAPALLLFAAIRVAVPAWNDDPEYLAGLPDSLRLVQRGTSEYRPAYLLQTIGGERATGLSWTMAGSCTAGTFGVLAMLLASLGMFRRPGLFVRWLPFLLLVYLQLLFAVDTKRLLVLGFPAIVLLAHEGVALLRERGGPGPFQLAPLLLLLIALNLWEKGRPAARLEFQLVAIALSAIFFFLRRNRRGDR